MSAQSVSRWNAIPMSRQEQDSTLKRPRSPDNRNATGDDEDDDVSLVSRSPSPDAMDVDDSSLSKYDEYVSGTAREVITVETKIKNTNKGFAMLAKLGWSEGQPLGLSGDGRVDPIPFQVKRDLTGLGKINQDVRMIETTVSQRRGLDSERQVKETEDQRKAREDSVARRAALQSEISTTLKAFYCTLCEKQFQNVAQYDEHTNSYAHHHKARFRDMQANQRAKPKEEVDKRKEKERKREEKELRKIAAAAGVKMVKPAVATVPGASTDTNDKPGGFKKSGWASIASSETQSAIKPARWATVQPPTLPPGQTLPLTPPPTRPTPQSTAAPAFRTAGWTSLDTGSSQPLPPPSSPPEVPSAHTGWAPAAPSKWNTVTPPPSLPPAPPPAVTPPPVQAPVASSRSGWQQFQQKGSRRR